MSYVLFADFECVESGSVNGQRQEIFTSLEDALSAYEGVRRSLLDKVGFEVGMIESSDSLEFSSPYLVWIVLFSLPKCATDVASVDAYFASRVQRCKRPRSFLEDRVDRAEGWIYSSTGIEVYPTREIVEALLEQYS